MILPPRLDDALKRLNAALDQLEAAASRRAQIEEGRGNLEEELALMQDDRAKLAVELDAALARSRALGLANDEVQQRLERTAAALRSLFPARAEAGEP